MLISAKNALGLPWNFDNLFMDTALHVINTYRAPSPFQSDTALTNLRSKL